MNARDRSSATAQYGGATAPVLILTGFTIFVVFIGYLIVSMVSPRSTVVYELSPVEPSAAPVGALVNDTVTIDALDPRRWQFFDFDRGSVVLAPDTAGWDLAVRRFSVIVAGAVADLGEIPFEAVEVVPNPTATFVETTFGRDTVNAAIDRWYGYSMWSHLLEPNGHVYLVRTREARYAKVDFLSYYCPGVVGGCLTFRYVYGGSRGQ